MSETNKTKRWIFIGVGILVIFSFFIASTYFRKKQTKIDFITAERSDLVQKVSVTGNVKSADEVNLGFDMSGKVSKVEVDVGDSVTKGQVLVVLSRGDLQAQLLIAQANLSEEQARLAKLKAGTRIEDINIQSVKVGSAKVALIDAQKDVINKLRDAYSKADDSVRGKADQLFNNPNSSNPKLSIIASNNQMKIDVESGRLLAGQAILKLESNLKKITNKSDFSSIVIKTDDNLYKVRDFLNNVSVVVNSLSENSSISKATIDKYKSDIWLARSNVNTAISNITTAQGKLSSAQRALILAQNELALKIAPATVEDILMQESRVRSAEANIQNAEIRLSKAFLYSPISGVITKVNVKVGEIVSANASVVSVSSINLSEIEANVVESDIEKISIGDSAEVTLDAYNDNLIFRAKVIKIDPADIVIDGVPTYKVTFKFFSNNKSVKPGMTANIDILTDKKINVIAIPARAVKTESGIKLVRILKDDGGIDKRKVEIGLRGSDGRIEILKGVDDGEKVITYMP